MREQIVRDGAEAFHLEATDMPSYPLNWDYENSHFLDGAYSEMTLWEKLGLT